MDLNAYFDQAKGHGVLATADASGRVNLAIFARPHVMEDNSVAFIMPHRLTHNNLESNPQAAYLFLEAGPGYKGKRLYLTRFRRSRMPTRLRSLRRKTYSEEKEKEGPRFSIFFPGGPGLAGGGRRRPRDEIRFSGPQQGRATKYVPTNRRYLKPPAERSQHDHVSDHR